MTDTLANPDASATIARFVPVPGGLIPALHALQHQFGYVDRRLIPELAEAFNVTDAEVHGVITYYPDFRTEPPKGPIIQVCRAEACQARGVEALVPAAEAAAGERVRLSPVYCLGLCSVGPAARVGDRVYARLDEAALVDLIEAA